MEKFNPVILRRAIVIGMVASWVSGFFLARSLYM